MVKISQKLYRFFTGRGAISRDTMFELVRSGEILPDGRTNEDEKALIAAGTGASGSTGKN